MEYTWQTGTVTAFKVFEDFADTVYQVEWRLTGSESVSDKKYQAQETGKTDLDVDAIDPSAYVEKNDITQEIAIGWVQGALGEDKIIEMKAQIETKIEEKKDTNEESFAVPVTEI